MAQNNSEKYFDSDVCVDVSRVFDSCNDKDCYEDLRVYIPGCYQEHVCNASAVRVISAEVIYTSVTVEPLGYHKGFYTVDMTFYLDVLCEVCKPGSSYKKRGHNQRFNGVTMFSKKVVLYGGDSHFKSFSSCEDDYRKKRCDCEYPKATVKVSHPVVLSYKLIENGLGAAANPGVLPQPVCDYFEDFSPACPSKILYCTIGVFTITELTRDVTMMIPASCYFLPCKECIGEHHPEHKDPCETFRKIPFPKDDFIPEDDFRELKEEDED